MQRNRARLSELASAASPRLAVARVTQWLRGMGHSDSRERTVTLQILKATAAAVAAWTIAVPILGSQAGWMAPMTAVLAVQATVYRSVADGLRRVAAVGAGAALAVTAGHLLGYGALELALVLPVALAMSRWRTAGVEGEYVPVTAVVLLTVGAATQGDYVLAYVLEAGLGAAVGTLVNAFVFPPQYLRGARAAVQEMTTQISGLLRDMGRTVRADWDFEQADEWVQRAHELQTRAHEAQSAVDWGKESRRWNPRGAHRSDAGSAYQSDLDTLWHVIIDVIAIARTLREIADSERAGVESNESFDRDFAGLLELLAQALEHAAEASVLADVPYRLRRNEADAEDARSIIDRLGEEILHGRDLMAPARVTTGELLLSARRVLDHVNQ